MKNFKKQAFVAIGGLTLIMNAGVASSSTMASAMIDWGTFAITGYGLGNSAAPTYTLSGQSSNASSNVTDWLNWNADTANNAHSFAASTDGTTAGTGSATVTRTANLNVSGNGFLLITADYVLNAAINENSNNSNYYYYDYNSASASIIFNLSNNSSSITSGSSNFQANIGLGNPWYGNSTPLSDQKQGTLSVGVVVHNGELLNFSTTASSNAHQAFDLSPIIIGGGGSLDIGSGSGSITITSNPPVFGGPILIASAPASIPLPAAVWLFGSALLGFIGLGRRKLAVTA